MDKYIRRICWIVMTITLSAFLVGCAEPVLSPDQMDWSPSTSNSCLGPCWHGLVVDKSSEGEVTSTLPMLAFIDQKTIEIRRAETMPNFDYSKYDKGSIVTGRCIHSDQQCISLTVFGDILTEIQVMLNYKIRISEVIGDLGNPDYVGYQLMGAETVTCEVVLIWIRKQLVLTSEEYSWDSSNAKDNCIVVHDTGKPTANLIISKATYKSIPTIEYMFTRDGSRYFNFTGTIPGQ
jgi:hypothetical protein